MAKLSLQFHALREELAVLAAAIRENSKYFIYVTTEKPFTVALWDGKSDGFCGKESCVRSLLVTLVLADTNCENVDSFLEKNPDTLILDMGRISDRGLSESWLAALTENDVAMKEWRKIANEVKRFTSAGVFAKNPTNGVKVLMRAYRVSKGARLAYSNGIALLPAAGNAILEPV